MSWISADGQHEGHVFSLFADGFAGRGWSAGGVIVTMAPDGTVLPPAERPAPRSFSAVVGWLVGCECEDSGTNWWGEPWSRGDVTDLEVRVLLGVPGDPAGERAVPGDPNVVASEVLREEWRQHLKPVVLELTRVADAYEAVQNANHELDLAVGEARDAGASWERIGEATAMKRQSAHERWGYRD